MKLTDKERTQHLPPLGTVVRVCDNSEAVVIGYGFQYLPVLVVVPFGGHYSGRPIAMPFDMISWWEWDEPIKRILRHTSGFVKVRHGDKVICRMPVLFEECLDGSWAAQDVSFIAPAESNYEVTMEIHGVVYLGESVRASVGQNVIIRPIIHTALRDCCVRPVERI